MNSARTYDSQQRASPILEEFVALLRYRDFIGQLILKGVKTRYKRSLFGVAWTMLYPLLTMSVLTLVFSGIFKSSRSDYALYVLSGLIVWNFFSQSTTSAAGDLLWSGGIVGKVNVPKSAFAVSALGIGLVNLFLALIVYTLIALVLGYTIGPSSVLLPIPILLLCLFTLGVGLTVSAAAVYFPDVLPTYEILLMAWLYLTPVIYPVELVPSGVRNVLRFNPLYHLTEAFRAILLEGTLPDSETVLAGGLAAVLSVVAGWWIFTRKARDLAYRI
jgi:ABC-type polysaccharide/polyol phosphate export permease